MLLLIRQDTALELGLHIYYSNSAKLRELQLALQTQRTFDHFVLQVHLVTKDTNAGPCHHHDTSGCLGRILPGLASCRPDQGAQRAGALMSFRCCALLFLHGCDSCKLCMLKFSQFYSNALSVMSSVFQVSAFIGLELGYLIQELCIEVEKQRRFSESFSPLHWLHHIGILFALPWYYKYKIGDFFFGAFFLVC